MALKAVNPPLGAWATGVAQPYCFHACACIRGVGGVGLSVPSSQ